MTPEPIDIARGNRRYQDQMAAALVAGLRRRLFVLPEQRLGRRAGRARGSRLPAPPPRRPALARHSRPSR